MAALCRHWGLQAYQVLVWSPEALKTVKSEARQGVLLVHGKNSTSGKCVYCAAWGNGISTSEGGRNKKITVSLLSRLVFWMHLRKSLTLSESRALQLTLEPLPEHRMWPSAPSPSAMEILLIRIRISRFPANLKLERVIWGRRMQNKILNDSLPFNKGRQSQPLLPRKSCLWLEETDGAIDLDSGWLEHGEVAMSSRRWARCLDRV